MKKVWAIVLSLMLLAVFIFGCGPAAPPTPPPAPPPAPAPEIVADNPIGAPKL